MGEVDPLTGFPIEKIDLSTQSVQKEGEISIQKYPPHNIPPLSPINIEQQEKEETGFDQLGKLLDEKLKDNVLWKQKTDKTCENYTQAKEKGKIGAFIQEAMGVLYTELKEEGIIPSVSKGGQELVVAPWEKLNVLVSQLLRNIPAKLADVYGVLTRGVDSSGNVIKSDKEGPIEKLLRNNLGIDYKVWESIGKWISSGNLVLDSTILVCAHKSLKQAQKILKELEEELQVLEKQLPELDKDLLLMEYYRIYKSQYDQIKNVVEKSAESVKGLYRQYFFSHGGSFINVVAERTSDLLGDYKMGHVLASTIVGSVAAALISILSGIQKWHGVYRMKQTEKEIGKYEQRVRDMVYKYQLQPKKLQGWEMERWLEENSDQVVEVLSGILFQSDDLDELYINCGIRAEQLEMERDKYWMVGEKGYRHAVSKELFFFLANQIKLGLKDDGLKNFEKRLKPIFSKKITLKKDQLFVELKELLINKSVFYQLFKNLAEEQLRRDSRLERPLKQLQIGFEERFQIWMKNNGSVIQMMRADLLEATINVLKEKTDIGGGLCFQENDKCWILGENAFKREISKELFSFLKNREVKEERAEEILKEFRGLVNEEKFFNDLLRNALQKNPQQLPLSEKKPTQEALVIDHVIDKRALEHQKMVQGELENVKQVIEKIPQEGEILQYLEKNKIPLKELKVDYFSEQEMKTGGHIHKFYLVLANNEKMEISNALASLIDPKIIEEVIELKDLGVLSNNELVVFLQNEKVQQALASQKAHQEQARRALVSKGLKTMYSANLENKKSFFRGNLLQKLFGAVGFTGLGITTIVLKFIIVFAVGGAVVAAGSAMPFILCASAVFSVGLIILGALYVWYKNPELVKASYKLIPLRISLGGFEKGIVEFGVKKKAAQMDSEVLKRIHQFRIEKKDIEAIKKAQNKEELLKDAHLKSVLEGVLGKLDDRGLNDIIKAFEIQIPPSAYSYINWLTRLNYLNAYTQDLQNQLSDHARRDMQRLRGFLTVKKKDTSWDYFANLIEGLVSGEALDDPEIGEILKLHGINSAEVKQKVLAMRGEDPKLAEQARRWMDGQLNGHLLREGSGLAGYYKGVEMKEQQRLKEERLK